MDVCRTLVERASCRQRASSSRAVALLLGADRARPLPGLIGAGCRGEFQVLLLSTETRTLEVAAGRDGLGLATWFVKGLRGYVELVVRDR